MWAGLGGSPAKGSRGCRALMQLEEQHLPDQECVVLKVVFGVTHEVTKPDSLGVSCYNASACKQSSMDSRLAFRDMMSFAALDTKGLLSANAHMAVTSMLGCSD